MTKTERGHIGALGAAKRRAEYKEKGLCYSCGQPIMGCVASIDIDQFPIQGTYLGAAVDVVFHYHYGRQELRGTVVRDDTEAPFLTIIRLEDGRYVLGTECQYRPAQERP